ncbi:carbamate kinase [Escherichia coli]|uniref:carbamate kinase n=1 Tax=Escherichia coli TaxID=562 RepID=UPI000F6382B8|nr:carbamate kinase [Escherichia coli]EEZ5222945.1 carbamate kinase [Escherichia coli]EFA7424793.1 carbamate kinase [Escherichia coli]EFA7557851.1 carbamate kinase [Escherichia coli]EFA7562568.1 carbamate kinase [Escherichia coli]EFA7571848.1 carbamate kinase [Escherichia coli]
MKELVVVAIGGNSIIKDNASQSIEHQAEAVKAVADTVLEMLASDYDIVLTHGNGPQVGLDLRRAVASPEPKRIVEAPAIKALIQQGFVVIGAGGGGIPVVRTEAGDYQSVDAVIDKDLSTALLAREIHADILVITTGIEKVCIQFGKPQQQALDRVDIATMTRYMQEGHFPPGSMLPKIIASLTFLEQGGKEVIITTPECLPAALRGETGTHIIKT